jgi:membrane protein required for colicin V production
LTNRLLGALLAIFKYALVLSIFLNVYQNLDKKEKIISKTRKQSSALYYPVTNLVPKIMPYVDRNFMK